jgi:hypothetical protein
MASRTIWIKPMVKYTFNYQTTAFDLWQLSMYSIYGSIVGVCNVIFTVAVFLLTLKFWLEVNLFIKALLIISICLFTLIQPLAIYKRAKRQVAALPSNLEIEFNDRGVCVKSENKTSHLKWSEIKKILKKPNMIVVISNSKNGFILTNRVLGKQKNSFYHDVVSKIKK